MSQFKGIAFAPLLAQIHAQAFSAPWSEQSFLSLLKLPTTVGWANEHGFLLTSDLGDDMEILTLAILPTERRKGYANSLMTELITWAKQHHKTSIFLEVAQDNIPAQNLYVKTGFVQTGKRPNYYKRGKASVDAICMTLSLNSSEEF